MSIFADAGVEVTATTPGLLFVRVAEGHAAWISGIDGPLPTDRRQRSGYTLYLNRLSDHSLFTTAHSGPSTAAFAAEVADLLQRIDALNFRPGRQRPQRSRGFQTLPTSQADLANRTARMYPSAPGETLPCMVIAGVQIYAYVDASSGALRVVIHPEDAGPDLRDDTGQTRLVITASTLALLDTRRPTGGAQGLAVDPGKAVGAIYRLHAALDEHNIETGSLWNGSDVINILSDWFQGLGLSFPDLDLDNDASDAPE
ncbi:hypothetical protein DQ384_39345 [Sphaerisporangium album]|uniref:Uncharacterized protein n=1 Tax=Sphaerisporangium album TaxID=509200 RepID=A0A367EKF7_9ACTN|nr:hypothetical protein DQ384_39345 [Sphaerisporangium album]